MIFADRCAKACATYGRLLATDLTCNGYGDLMAAKAVFDICDITKIHRIGDVARSGSCVQGHRSHYQVRPGRYAADTAWRVDPARPGLGPFTPPATVGPN